MRLASTRSIGTHSGRRLGLAVAWLGTPRAWLSGVALLLVVGCGPKVNLEPSFTEATPQIFALLPLSGPPEARRERLEFLQASLASELRNEGFYLLDERIVNRVCATPGCPERTQLVERYPVDGFIELTIETISRNDFGLGFYNTIVGTLKVADRGGKELAVVEYQESQRGGLLFQSGQVFQGIKESVANAGDESFNHLAAKFVGTVVDSLPEPRAQEGDENDAAAAIASVSARKTSPAIYEICARGTPNSLASLVLGRRKTNLRETEPGFYCGIYRLNSDLSKDLAVELRSAFGSPVREPVDLEVARSCDLRKGIKVARKGAVNELTLSCIAFQGGSGRSTSAGCTEASQCVADKVLIFKAPAESGPFRKVAEIRKSTWRDDHLKDGESAYYQIVAVSEEGITSRPVSIDPQTAQN